MESYREKEVSLSNTFLRRKIRILLSEKALKKTDDSSNKNNRQMTQFRSDMSERLKKGKFQSLSKSSRTNRNFQKPPSPANATQISKVLIVGARLLFPSKCTRRSANYSAQVLVKLKVNQRLQKVEADALSLLASVLLSQLVPFKENVGCPLPVVLRHKRQIQISCYSPN